MYKVSVYYFVVMATPSEAVFTKVISKNEQNVSLSFE